MDEIVAASGSFVVGVDLTAKDFEPPLKFSKSKFSVIMIYHRLNTFHGACENLFS